MWSRFLLTSTGIMLLLVSAVAACLNTPSVMKIRKLTSSLHMIGSATCGGPVYVLDGVISFFFLAITAGLRFKKDLLKDDIFQKRIVEFQGLPI